MNIADIQSLKGDLKRESDSVNQAIVRTRVDMDRGKGELSDLETRLTRLLAQFYFKWIPKNEIVGTGKGRGEFRKFLEDNTFISVGLGDFIKTLSTKGDRFSLSEKQVRRYEILENEPQKWHCAHLEYGLLASVSLDSMGQN